jgi:hypothetical protein
MPPRDDIFGGFMALATMWRKVVMDAERKGQSIIVRANADTVPPAQVVSLSEEQFEAYLKGEWVPGE